jgi:MtfA peptidase
MPHDTIWFNTRGSFFVNDSNSNLDASSIAEVIESLGMNPNDTYAYNVKNSSTADSVLRILIIDQAKNKKIAFEKDKAEYDSLANILQFFILLAAISLGIYSYRRAKKYKENPFDEDERDWVEIGSSPRNNFEQSSSDNGIIYSKPSPKPIKEYLTYNGRDLKFDEAQIIAVLQKRFVYFNALGMAEQRRFLARHKKFMRSKIFKIHTYNGFKEMPILISATAIQLSFGLDEFMLPFYQYIHIFPQEFLGMHPTMRFLEGNVSGNSINISWKHYLEGNKKKNDGQNLGLHEMAHAYYSQNFTFDGEKDKCFINGFSSYNSCGNKIFEAEKIQSGNLFSDYALKNFQEFWAESVEIFFERPRDMKAQYEELYESMSLLLNQRPA